MERLPGDLEMRFQALPDSALPASLRSMGYIVEPIGETHRMTHRILPHAVTERFETSSSGALIAAVEGSTNPVAVKVHHAGIAIVDQFDLRLP
jgi:hypothetical protein